MSDYPVVVPFERAAHYVAVVTLWTEVFGYGTAHNDPALAIEKKMEVGDGLFLVAEDESGNVIGTVMGGYDGHRGWIYSLAVAADARLKGVGTALVKQVESALLELGCPKINLQIVEGNSAVAGFYEKLGYSTELRVSMGKRLIE